MAKFRKELVKKFAKTNLTEDQLVAKGLTPDEVGDVLLIRGGELSESDIATVMAGEGRRGGGVAPTPLRPDFTPIKTIEQVEAERRQVEFAKTAPVKTIEQVEAEQRQLEFTKIGQLQIFDIGQREQDAAFLKNFTVLADGTAVTKGQLADLKKRDAGLAAALLKGVETFKFEQNKRTVDFNRENIKTAAGEYIDRKTWSEIQKTDTDAAKVIWTQGIDKYNKDVQSEIDRNEILYGRTKAEKTLDRFFVVGGTQAILNNPFKFARFAKDHGLDISKLETPDSSLRQKGDSPISFNQYVANFMGSRGEDAPKIVTFAAATQRYRELYGIKNLEKAIGVEGATLLFPPAKALKPEFTLKDVTPMDWGIGAAQIVLLALPGVGAVVGKVAGATVSRVTTSSLGLAAGGVFTADTVRHWDDMGNVGKGVSVALDTFIIGASLVGLSGPIRAAANKAKKSAAGFFEKAGPKFTKGFTGAKIPRPKVSPRQTQFTKEVLQITEGGRVGAGWGAAGNAELITAVTSGRKPLAIVVSSKVRGGRRTKYVTFIDDLKRMAADKGLTIKRVPGGKDVKFPNYYVFKNNATGRGSWRQAVEATTKYTVNDIEFHVGLGKALGYTPQDIRAYLNNVATIEAQLFQDFAWREAIRKISIGLAENKPAMLKDGARDIKLLSQRIPDKLGGNVIRARAAQIEANPSQWIKIAGDTGKQSDDALKQMAQSLDDNAKHLDDIERRIAATRRKPRQETLDAERKRIKEIIERQTKKYKEEVRKKTETVVKEKTWRDIFDPRKFKQQPTTTALTVRKTSITKPGTGGKVAPTKETAIALSAKKTITTVGVSASDARQRRLALEAKPKVSTSLRRQRVNVTRIDDAVESYRQELRGLGLSTQRVNALSDDLKQKLNEETELDTKTITETKIKQITEQEIKDVIKEAEETKPVTETEVGIKIEEVTAQKEREKIKEKIRPRRGGTDKDRRDFIKESGGAIAWRQGELFGKDVWAVFVSPYASNSDLVAVLGQAPQGAQIARGKRSAFRSISRLRGDKLPRNNTTIDWGIMDIAIERANRRIGLRFTPDPKQLTTSEFDIRKRPKTLKKRGTIKLRLRR